MLSMPTPRFVAAVPVLPVSDERRAVAFFVEALGFAELADAEGRGHGILNRDAVQVHVWVADGSAPGAEAHLAGSASCRLEVVGVDALHERCAALGIVHPNGALGLRPWGSREFSILDPDGNLITLYEWPSAG
jgi:catechol 2,3-dioxygenase-like lactoylglutathione lyase family enzyme